MFCQVKWPQHTKVDAVSPFHRCAGRCPMSGYVMRQMRSAEAAWQRGTNSGKVGINHIE